MFCPELRRIWARIQGVGSLAYRDIRDFPQRRRRVYRQASKERLGGFLHLNPKPAALAEGGRLISRSALYKMKTGVLLSPESNRNHLPHTNGSQKMIWGYPSTRIAFFLGVPG
jgi:hypothetical protein